MAIPSINRNRFIFRTIKKEQPTDRDPYVYILRLRQYIGTRADESRYIYIFRYPKEQIDYSLVGETQTARRFVVIY